MEHRAVERAELQRMRAELRIPSDFDIAQISWRPDSHDVAWRRALSHRQTWPMRQQNSSLIRSGGFIFFGFLLSYVTHGLALASLSRPSVTIYAMADAGSIGQDGLHAGS